MMTLDNLQQHRLLVALNFVVNATEEDRPQALLNADNVLKCFETVTFVPDAEGCSIDDSPDGAVTESNGDRLHGDVYLDGIWQPNLIGVLEHELVFGGNED